MFVHLVRGVLWIDRYLAESDTWPPHGIARIRPCRCVRGRVSHFDTIYFNNPCDFIAGEHEVGRLKDLRRVDIILAVGRDDPLRASNEQLSGQLWVKGIPHVLRVWDGAAHEWPFWSQMMNRYVAGPD